MITEKSIWVTKEHMWGVNCWVGGQLDEGVFGKRDSEMGGWRQKGVLWVRKQIRWVTH